MEDRTRASSLFIAASLVRKSEETEGMEGRERGKERGREGEGKGKGKRKKSEAKIGGGKMSPKERQTD